MGEHSSSPSLILKPRLELRLLALPMPIGCIVVACHVNSTLACALVPAKLHIRLGHLEVAPHSDDRVITSLMDVCLSISNGFSTGSGNSGRTLTEAAAHYPNSSAHEGPSPGFRGAAQLQEGRWVQLSKELR